MQELVENKAITVNTNLAFYEIYMHFSFRAYFNSKTAVTLYKAQLYIH